MHASKQQKFISIQCHYFYCKIREYVGDYLEPLPTDVKLKPYCPDVPTSLLSMDHLVGVRMRDQLHVASEAGLKEAFQGNF